jgi:hypothetical protein
MALGARGNPFEMGFSGGSNLMAPREGRRAVVEIAMAGPRDCWPIYALLCSSWLIYALPALPLARLRIPPDLPLVLPNQRARCRLFVARRRADPHPSRDPTARHNEQTASTAQSEFAQSPERKPCHPAISAGQPTTDHPRHVELAWSFCYTDSCSIHRSSKEGSGYWPRKRKPVYWEQEPGYSINRSTTSDRQSTKDTGWCKEIDAIRRMRVA